MQKKLEGNIWKYTILSIINKRIFVAIWTVFYLTISGVDVSDVGLIAFSGMLAGFIMEVPSGYISDKIGHRKALILARIILTGSTAAFLFAQSITLLFAGAVLMGIGTSFMTGTGSAFMHETLRALGKEDQYAEIVGKVRSVGFAVPAVFMALVPFLVTISYRLPFAIALVLDIISVVVAFSLVAPPVTPQEVEEIGVTNFRQVIKEGLRLKYFRYALYGGLAAGMMLGLSSFRAPYQEFIGVPVVWFGVLLATGRFLASFMLAYSGVIKKWLSIKSFYLIEMFFYAAVFFGLGTFADPYIVVVLFIILNGFRWGFSHISTSYLLEVAGSSKFKATLLSTSAQIYQIVGGVLGYVLGNLIEQYSYQFAFSFLGVLTLVALSPLYLYVLKGEARRVKAKTAGQV